MINLRMYTEYSFRKAFAHIKTVVQRGLDDGAMAITDSSGTWGHVAFYTECKKQGVKPILGVALNVVPALIKERKQTVNSMVFLAKNEQGLREIYELTSLSTAQQYYIPRISYEQAMMASITKNVVVLSGTNWAEGQFDWIQSFGEDFYFEANVSAPGWNRYVIELAKHHERPIVVTNSACFLSAEDRVAYNLMIGTRLETRVAPMHLMTEAELRLEMPYLSDDAFSSSDKIASMCNVELGKAQMVKFPHERDLRVMCLEGAGRKCLAVLDEKHAAHAEYMARLDRELELIAEKGYKDYFLVIADMIKEAKKTMLVGPSRGSSAGSLVCYLLDITEVDPILYGLIFERFIDITREDLPDIDIDFPDIKRGAVIEYLREKYGEECVAHLGTVSRFKPKSAITDVSKTLGIPAWESKDVKGAIIERSGGDARAAFCIADTFETLDVGKEFLKKYPEMIVTAQIEGHSRHTGKHAAGILVTELPVHSYCSIDRRDGIAQLDKKDAEKIDLLKIDALGLRTLTVLEQTIDQLEGWKYSDLYTLPTDDLKAFEVFNLMHLAGIFQFEGYALQSLTRQMGIREFNDIVAITSLARPGPLHCGGATAFVQRRIGKEDPAPLHPVLHPFTKDTQGTIVYQEQVMQIGREVGELSWEDVSELRKAMSKSLGEEFFNKYWKMFESGARKKHNLSTKDAKAIWENMCTFGSWAFNLSHAVSYAMISYWCAYMKAHHPLEFAVGCLNNAKDEEQTVKVLRELVKEGFEYVPVDEALSEERWAVKEGKLIGGLLNIKGVGVTTARKIISTRKKGGELTPALRRKVAMAETPYDDIFPQERLWGELIRDPDAHDVRGPITMLKDVQEDGEYCVVVRLMEKNLRDLNEYGNVVKRGGKIVDRLNLFLNLMMEDDTDSIIATVTRHDYPRMGKPIVEGAREGDWFLVRGKIKNNWRKLYITKIKKLEIQG